MFSRSAAGALLGALGLLLAACAAQPTYPLLTPVDVARSFGYSDIRLPDGRYEVSYVAPAQQGYGYRFDQSPTERMGKSLAFDMAIWRAAQIAQAQGYRGFSVADTRSNSDIQQRAGYYDDPWDGPWGPGPWGPGPYWGWHRPPYGWGGAYYNPPETSVQVEVKLAVALSNDLKPGDYDAADAIQQLRRTYPGADGGVAAPPSPAAGPTVAPVPGAPVPGSAPAPAPLPWQQQPTTPKS
ncbi:hypothetical protein GCM10011611_51920 [Aliidongia dinghuensis]|uniref:DUF4136 domain-containing protein n=1 Tax=Aliidongia dinghuensis TaxID=1867774 RepID=A0A8J3E5Y5_9PROT|nr:hypothetical protein [Aliidongia dinghuensis]GGF39175.1 hypothetical protein GCM10011611_51920 [Aliidongia dinghuensis]